MATAAGARSNVLNLHLQVWGTSSFTTEFKEGSQKDPECMMSLYYGSVETINLLKASVKSSQSFRWITSLSAEPVAMGEDQSVLWHGIKIPLNSALSINFS
jgi:hypothetical protein